MKKVLVLGPAYPYRGGLAAYNERLTKEFQNEGWTAEIITFRFSIPISCFLAKRSFRRNRLPKA